MYFLICNCNLPRCRCNPNLVCCQPFHTAFGPGQQCNPLVGLSGTTPCIHLQAYSNQCQWAICLLTVPFINKVATDTIVETPKTDIDSTSACMLSMFSIESGSVARDCSCLLEIYRHHATVYLVILVSGIVIVL